VEGEVLKARLNFKYFANRFVSSFYFKNTHLAKEEISLFVAVRPRGFLYSFFSAALAKLRKAIVSFVRSSRIQARLFDKMFRIAFVFRSVCKIAKSDCLVMFASPSVHLEHLGSTGRIFLAFDI